MANLIKSQVKNEVYYYDIDANESGCSVSALARLAGVARTTIDKILDKISLSESTAPELTIYGLESFAGMEFPLRPVENGTTVKLIPAKVAHLIIEYYAFYSKAGINETAKISYRALAAVGTEAYFREKSGYKQSAITDNSYLTKLLGDMAESQKRLETKFNEEIKGIKEELNTANNELEAIEQASELHPGASALIDAEIDSDTDVEYDHYVSVDQFLTSIGLFDIDKSMLNTIRRRACTFYRTDKHKDPKKITNKNVFRGTETEYIKQAIRSVLGF